MSSMFSKYAFYRGDVLLGDISPTHSDFPWHYGDFEPTDDFQAVAMLFVKELVLLESSKGSKDWDTAYNTISNPGLRLEPYGPGKSINNPLIHIQGGKAWWR